jgi:virulence-associated protein VapD
MYAITFDLSVEELLKYYPTAYNNAYGDIGKFLHNKGFNRQQGSVYFGDDTINAVTAVVIVSEMSQKLPWFKQCVSDIRMLRIEENNDLTVAL